jgi:hypothetical protein
MKCECNFIGLECINLVPFLHHVGKDPSLKGQGPIKAKC